MELSATDGALGSQLVQLQLQELVKVSVTSSCFCRVLASTHHARALLL